jgi:hypothetical protein
MVVAHLSPSYLVHAVEVEVISYGILHVVEVQLMQSYPVIIADVSAISRAYGKIHLQP